MEEFAMSQVVCEGTAVLSYGAYLQVQDPADQSWLYLAGLTGFNGPNVTRGEIDVTKLCSDAKEYVLDLKDNGTLTADCQTMLGTRSQRLVWAGLDATDAYNFRLVLPDDGLGNGIVTMTFAARVSGFPITGAMGQVLTSSLSLRITGDIDIEYPADLGAHLSYTGFTLEESSENDGAISGVIGVVVSGDTFTGAPGDALAGVTFTNVPTGLTANAQKINDTTAIINFSGAAASHDAGTSVAVGVTFGDAAFTTGPASAIGGTSNRQITINFI